MAYTETAQMSQQLKDEIETLTLAWAGSASMVMFIIPIFSELLLPLLE